MQRTLSLKKIALLNASLLMKGRKDSGPFCFQRATRYFHDSPPMVSLMPA